MKTQFKHLGMGVILVAVALTAMANPTRAASPDEQARDLFVAQRYPEALAIYERLRAESHHPTYLRNIGRCHQMMRQPTPAIAAFEGYLREAPGLGAAERTEVDGYIAEMRRLEAGAAPPQQNPAPPPPGALLTPAPGGNAATPLFATSAPAASDGDSSILKKWWFWAGVGALVVAGGIIIAASSSSDPQRLPCPGGAVCP